MKKLIHREQQPIDELKEKLEYAQALLNNAYQLFKQAPYYTEDHTLIDMLQNLDPIVRRYKLSLMEQEQPIISTKNLHLSKEKFAELLEVNEPKGIRTAISRANHSLNQDKINLKYFLFENDKIVINHDLFQEWIDRHSIYASTPNEQKFLRKYQQLGKALEEFSNYVRSECDILLIPRPLNPFHIAMWFELDEENHYQVKPKKFALLSKRLKNN